MVVKDTRIIPFVVLLSLTDGQLKIIILLDNDEMLLLLLTSLSKFFSKDFVDCLRVFMQLGVACSLRALSSNLSA